MTGSDVVDAAANAAFTALQAKARAEFAGNTQPLLVVYAVESFLRRLAMSDYADTDDMFEHKLRRDLVAGIEKRLAEDLEAAGYDVVNTVVSTKPLDENAYADVRSAFAAHFPRLGNEA